MADPGPDSSSISDHSVTCKAPTTSRNKRKMTLPKRLLPSNDDRVITGLSHHDNVDSETETDEEVRTMFLSASNRPLDLRSSTEVIMDDDDTEDNMTIVTHHDTLSCIDDPIRSSDISGAICHSTEIVDNRLPDEEQTIPRCHGNATIGEEKSRSDVVINRKSNKHMTRQRRMEANARERSRVHTISAAFESLRRAVPSYAYNQRLSKLAILRIASSYIVALARLADIDDYSRSQSIDGELDFAECVDICTRTIQAEGRAKRRN